MAICLPASLAWRKFAHRGSNATDLEEEEPLLPSPTPGASVFSLESLATSTRSWWRRYDAVLAPTLFDLTASSLLSVGLLFIATSLYQMVRGTEVIFTAILSMVILRRRLNTQNVWGLALTATGLTIVGVSGYLAAAGASHANESSAAPPSPAQALLGMGLVVLAEAVQSAQVVAEDFLMTTADTQLPPVDVVGYEGLFGLAIMSAVILPALQFSTLGPEGGGLREDTIESFQMLARSPRLAGTAAAYVLLMTAYNLAGVLVTDSMGALSRTVAETVRTLIVWILNLFLYYNVSIKGERRVGEPWTAQSWLQAVGFAVLVGGTAVYARGEELHAKEVHECLAARARTEWGVVRARLQELARLEEEEGGLTAAEGRTPARPARIAGPARIRVALGLMQLRQRLRRRRAPRRGGDGGAEDGQGGGV
jgi:drug/metabolite transporter (DMT)-like permease